MYTGRYGIGGISHSYLEFLFPSTTTAWIQCAVELTSGLPTVPPGSNAGALFAFMQWPTLTHLYIGWNTSTYALEVWLNGSMIATSGPTGLTANAWHFMTAYVVLDDTNGRVIVTQDGIQFINYTGDTNNGGSFINEISVGNPCDTLYYDDVVIGNGDGAVNTMPPGDARVEYIPPTGAGAKTMFTPSTGVNWQTVDDTTANPDTDYNTSSQQTAMDLFQMADLGGTGTIYGVQSVLRVRKDDAGIRLVRPALYKAVGAGNTPRLYTGTDVNVLGTFQYASQIWDKSPDTGVAWTADEVNNLQFGYFVGGTDGVFSADAWIVGA